MKRGVEKKVVLGKKCGRERSVSGSSVWKELVGEVGCGGECSTVVRKGWWGGIQVGLLFFSKSKKRVIKEKSKALTVHRRAVRKARGEGREWKNSRNSVIVSKKTKKKMPSGESGGIFE